MNHPATPNSLILPSALICTVFVLYPSEIIFSRYALSDLLCQTPKLRTTSIPIINFVKELINKKTLRQLSYDLIQPTLPFLLHQCTNQEGIAKNTKLLKKYLRKFKYVYRAYFLDGLTSSKGELTEKELNTIALNSLYQLLGV